MRLIDKISTLLFKFKYRKNINNPSVVIGSKNIKIGKKSIIRPFGTLKAKRGDSHGKITIGKSVYIGENSYILGGNGTVHIGDSLYAGNNLILLGGGNITIGNNVLMSHNIVIASSSHEFKDKKILADKAPPTFKTVTISDSVFIGANVTILMGTTIGYGAIIGAGSVVIENTTINENEIWVGNPAKRIKSRVSLKEQIEEEMLDYLKKYPFHNLFFLYELKDVFASEYGGTCSDRTIHFKNKLDKKFKCTSIDIKLHRAFINGKKTHTILKIEIDSKIYFCDVGMGFPISKLIPSYKNIEFISYEIGFKSVVDNNKITVYIDEGKGEKELMQIDNEVQSQKEIKLDIEQRWEKKEQLPFNNKLRYFFIYKDKFYQIVDNDF
jgi:acetyltransferase-like isoleucine patch superfamily enzyme